MLLMLKSVLKQRVNIQFCILNESSATLSIEISSCLPITRAESPIPINSEEESLEAALRFRSPKARAICIWAEFDSRTKVMAECRRRSKPALVCYFFHRKRRRLQKV